jgi:hypothetical protein
MGGRGTFLHVIFIIHAMSRRPRSLAVIRPVGRLVESDRPPLVVGERERERERDLHLASIS